MSTMGPFKIGKVVGDAHCVVTDNPVDGYNGNTDDRERYGGTAVARGCTIENAALFAVAPDMLKLLDAILIDDYLSREDMRLECQRIKDRIFTRMPQ